MIMFMTRGLLHKRLESIADNGGIKIIAGEVLIVITIVSETKKRCNKRADRVNMFNIRTPS